MFITKKNAIIFIVIFFLFLGCSGGNNYEKQCDICDPNTLELYRGSVLSVARTESHITVKSCWSDDADIIMTWDEQNQNCSYQEDNYFIRDIISPGECISCEFKHHTSVRVCLFLLPTEIIDPYTGMPSIYIRLLESCFVILTNESLKPKKLLTYYGWPSRINQTYNVETAAIEFGKYDYVVLGEGFEDTNHPDHLNTVDIIAHSYTADTVFFGYIDLGVATNNFSIEEIKKQVDQWKKTGSHGIFFDNSGYDFGTHRERQNEAVEYVHNQLMPAMVNALHPEDVFLGEVDTIYNPLGISTSLGSEDFYYYENHQIKDCEFVLEEQWQEKANKIKMFQDVIGFKVLSVATCCELYNEEKFFYSWYSVLLYGHEATGWGECYFTKEFNSPFRDRPNINLGVSFISDVINEGPIYKRFTNSGEIFINTSTHEFGFISSR